MDFSFVEITIIARRKIYTVILSFRVLIKENQIHEIMSQKSCSKKKKKQARGGCFKLKTKFYRKEVQQLKYIQICCYTLRSEAV